MHCLQVKQVAAEQETTVRKFNVDQLKTLLLQEITMTRHSTAWKRDSLAKLGELWVYME